MRTRMVVAFVVRQYYLVLPLVAPGAQSEVYANAFLAPEALFAGTFGLMLSLGSSALEAVDEWSVSD